MRVSKLLFVAALPLLLASCKKEVVQKHVYDNVIYEVTPVALYATNADKQKQKTSTQYISILFTDLFNQSVPANSLNALEEVTLSIGDKTVASNLILQRLLNSPGVQIPTDDEMRNDIQQFVADTYVRFYLRNPTPYESYFLKKLIEDDTLVTPEMIYAAFAWSNEYYFY